MLHILFLILKIIGIIVLAILGIAIFLLCVLLFAPIRYWILAETTDGVENLVLHGKARWLFGLATAHFDYSERHLEWRARALWKRFPKPDIGGLKDGESEEHKSEEHQSEEHISEEQKLKIDRSEKRRLQGHKTQRCKSRKQIKRPKKKKYTIREICDKIKEIWQTKDKIITFVSDEIHQAAFGRVTKEILLLIKYLRPKKLNGKIRFGLKEPYDTGRVLAVLSMLYPFYGEHIQIYPEFEKEILEGNLMMKGRARLLPFINTLCKLYFDKNVRTAYNNFRRK